MPQQGKALQSSSSITHLCHPKQLFTCITKISNLRKRASLSMLPLHLPMQQHATSSMQKIVLQPILLRAIPSFIRARSFEALHLSPSHSAACLHASVLNRYPPSMLFCNWTLSLHLLENHLCRMLILAHYTFHLLRKHWRSTSHKGKITYDTKMEKRRADSKF
jgi:hypothetical protein